MNILIVDDEPLTVNALQNHLPWSEIGIDKVFTATDTVFAMKILASFPIDVVLCDIEMPGASGLELLLWIKDNGYGHIVSVLLTCHEDFAYAKAAIALGVLDYVIKPIPFAELTEVLKRAVAQSRQKTSEVDRIEGARLWQKNRESMVRLFWKEFFESPEAVPAEKLVELHLPPDGAKSYLLIIFENSRAAGKSGLPLLSDAELLHFLEDQLAEPFQYSGLAFSLVRISPATIYAIAWKRQIEHVRESLDYLYAQIRNIVFSFHMNQLDICACFDTFATLSSLGNVKRILEQYLSQHADLEFGVFRLDTDTQGAVAGLESGTSQLIASIREYVHDHLFDDITRSEIAEHVHLNSDYLSRHFKSETHLGLMEYVRNEKLLRSKYLLIKTDISISEIAAKLGFNSLSHYSSVFKKTFHISPNDYRKSADRASPGGARSVDAFKV